MFENFPSLLVTKLYIPPLRSSHVSRVHLFALLETGLEHKLILVAAAAGFGKTTLLADWAKHHADEVGWLSLDEGDNDPARFLSYLIAAIQTCHPHICQELLATLQSPQPPAPETAVRVLINQLATLPERLILVLDDYHVIENPAIHMALMFLLDHLPPQIHLVLSTRADPPLPLARLRAKNDLLELRASALRFSTEETTNFFNHTLRLNLSPESIAALDTRTEGWIAGLQLAAIALQTQQSDSHAFVQHFTGSHRFVLDYLMEEVLSRQPEQIRRFLLQTSILHRLNGALCHALTGDNDGQAMIEHLERNNLFIVPLDGSRYWYRYHHLFADLLLARLQAESPDTLPELYRRAAKWHEDNGLAEEAIGYALAAHDYDHAAQLIIGPGSGATRRGEVITLLEWYRQYPSEFVATHPTLCLRFGAAFALNGHWQEAETLLHRVEQAGYIEQHADETLPLAYLIASYRQDASRLDTIIDAIQQPDAATKVMLGLVANLKGDLLLACQLMREAFEVGEHDGDTSLALSALFHLCRLLTFAGRLHEAYQASQKALQWVRALGRAALPMASLAHVSLCRIHLEWNELEQAAAHVSESLRLAELSGFVTGMMSSSTIMQAEIKQAQGDSEAALDLAENAITYAERYDPPSEVLWLKTYQARLWLIQGNLTAAGGWLKVIQHEPPRLSLFYPHNILSVTQARVLLAQRKNEAAIALLTKLAAQAHDLFTVETLALLALARQLHGDSVNALLALEQALALGAAENRVRAFLDFGAPMAKLLARFCEAHPHHEFAQKLLALFPEQPAMLQAVEPLGERELEVLHLIVAGYSNEEIAQTLTLALSTVKWYINVLYAKLHVKTRSQAIARAHELRLLAD